MSKLQYDNIFEPIVSSKKQAAAMSTASDVLSDLEDALIVLGFSKDHRRAIGRAVRRLHFSRYS